MGAATLPPVPTLEDLRDVVLLGHNGRVPGEPTTPRARSRWNDDMLDREFRRYDSRFRDIEKAVEGHEVRDAEQMERLVRVETLLGVVNEGQKALTTTFAEMRGAFDSRHMQELERRAVSGERTVRYWITTGIAVVALLAVIADAAARAFS